MQTETERPSLAWLAFLMVAFLIVGLMGLFATYAAPLPLQREAAREAALDAAATAARQPDAAAALERLRPDLDDSAAAVLPAGPGIEQRIAEERTAMRARFAHESAVVSMRLRWLVLMVTVMGAAFGAACYFAGRRAAAPM